MDIKYPILYQKTETLFTNFGIAILSDAYDVVINQVLNEEYTLKFTAPLDAKLKAVIDTAFWVKCDNRIFYITKIVQKKGIGETISCEFTCEHISYYLRNSYINFAQYAGDSTKDIISALINGYTPDNSRFKPASWMIDNDNRKIDFRNKNVLEAFKDYAEKYAGEIDCADMPDNDGKFPIGIRIPTYDNNYVYIGGGKGSFKLDIQIRDKKNVVSLKKEIDTSNLVDKLYIFGKNGGTFEGTKIIYDRQGNPLAPANYIDIPANVQYLPINFSPTGDSRVGYVQFNDVDTKQELYWAAKTRFDEINKPRVNYQIDIVDLRYLEAFKGFDTFGVGDVVTFIDSDLTDSEKVQVRVTTYNCYPLEPEKNSATFSKITKNIFLTFAQFIKTTDTVAKMTNKNGQTVAGPEMTYIETSEVVEDTVNAPYYGIFVGNGYYTGTIFAGNTQDNLNRAGLFFHKKGTNVGGALDGGFYLYNNDGVGIQINDDELVPKIKYINGSRADILTTLNNIDALFDVVITSPQNGQVLKYDSATGKWKNSF